MAEKSTASFSVIKKLLKQNIGRNSTIKVKSAFTLAEVLITLTIIGVIAAMVIPNLMQRHIEAEMISKLKKNINVLNNAVSLAIRENGNIDEWDIGKNATLAGSERLYNYIKPYLKVQKEYNGTAGGFASKYKSLFGNSSSWSDINRWGYYKFTLEDGTEVALYGKGTGCSTGEIGTSALYRKDCGGIFIDLNGKRGPNRVGVDFFRLTFTEKNIMPYGFGVKKLYASSNKYGCKYNDTESTNGIYCATHVIYKGNMDYLRKSIENDWK